MGPLGFTRFQPNLTQVITQGNQTLSSHSHIIWKHIQSSTTQTQYYQSETNTKVSLYSRPLLRLGGGTSHGSLYNLDIRNGFGSQARAPRIVTSHGPYTITSLFTRRLHSYQRESNLPRLLVPYLHSASFAHTNASFAFTKIKWFRLSNFTQW